MNHNSFSCACAGSGRFQLSYRDVEEMMRERGLDEDVHLHRTRHTFARIVQEETGSFNETQEALDHENLATTCVYVQRIAVKADKHSCKVAERMKASRS